MITIRRFDTRQRHGYEAKSEAGEILCSDNPGITSCLNVLEKGGLPIWSARECGKAVGGAVLAKIHAYDTMGDVDFDSLVAELEVIANEAIADGYKFAQSIATKAADRGTDAHTLAELVAIEYHNKGHVSDTMLAEIVESHAPYESPDVPELAGYIRSWFARVKPEVLATEKPVVCLDCGYGATLDLVCKIDGGLWNLDIKSGKGVWETTGLQLVGQVHALVCTEKLNGRHGDGYILGGSDQYRTGALWVSSEADQGAEIVETHNRLSDLEAFQHVLAAWRWKRSNDWRVSPPKKPKRAA